MIMIVDFGGQLTWVIERRLRDLNIRCDIVRPGQEENFLATHKVLGIILSGGPNSVEHYHVTWVKELLAQSVAILGICFGHQVLGKCGGATVEQLGQRQYGPTQLTTLVCAPLFAGIPKVSTVWMSHGDTVKNLPMDWQVLGETEAGDCTVIGHRSRPWFGVQFHPEASHTEYGIRMLENFAKEICGAKADYFTSDLVQELEEHIRQQMDPDGHMLVACSCGVDSITLTELCQRALGVERVHPVFINNGLLRQEDIELAKYMQQHVCGLQIIDAQMEFLWPLAGVRDPAQKRRLIGYGFWEAFRLAAQKKHIATLAQGTISPDVIESGGSSSETAVIKQHHNMVPTPPDYPLCIFEPLRNFRLFKDQVRAIAKEIGIPQELIVRRHPFPGPGLAVRVSGPITQERLEICRAADAIWIAELRQSGFYDKVSQAGIAVQEDTSVCQHGDFREIGWSVQLWAYVTEDFMTASVANLPHEFIAKAALRIASEVRGVGRVGYNYTPKPPNTIEWE